MRKKQTLTLLNWILTLLIGFMMFLSSKNVGECVGKRQLVETE